MKRILLFLALILGLMLGGLLPMSTAEARPWGYRGYVYRPAVRVYAGPRYYRGYYAPYYRPYYRSYYRPYSGYYYGYPYGGGYYYYGPHVGVYVR